jgi:2-(1,2-epoxy-1,2-dihydrophenyl)acetyl-CoA isomerase
MTDTVIYESNAGVATLTLNRPEHLNTLGADLTTRTLDALERAASDATVRVVVLTGAGRAFCAGGDLERLKNAGGRGHMVHAAKVHDLRSTMRISQLLAEMDKITIAAINGACAGAGLAWACACDLRFAAERAKFNTAFRNVGLSGDYGGTWSLARVVGPAKARELYLLAPRIDAAEAARIGLVNKTLPDDQLMSHVASVAAELTAAAPVALALIKKNLNDALRLGFSELLDLEAERTIACAQTEDHREAVAAFLEKRKPAFQGR